MLKTTLPTTWGFGKPNKYTIGRVLGLYFGLIPGWHKAHMHVREQADIDLAVQQDIEWEKKGFRSDVDKWKSTTRSTVRITCVVFWVGKQME